MRKKNKKFIYIPIVAIAVLVIFILPDDFLGDGVEFVSVGDFFTFSHIGTKNFAVECFTKDALEIKYEGQSTYVQVSHETRTERPTFDIVNRHTGLKITDFRNAVHITCDFDESLIDTLSVKGKITFGITTNNGGADKLIKLVSVDIPSKTLKDNSPRLLVKLNFKSSEIEDLLLTNKADHSWVKVIMSPQLTFTQVGPAGTQQSFIDTSLSTAYLVKKSVEDEPSASIGGFVRIDSFDPKSFTKPLSSPKRFMTILGEADHYSSSEGVPTIQLIQPDGVLGGKIKMKELSNPSGDKWTQFTKTVQLPSDPKVGKWQIKMSSPAVTRQDSYRDFQVYPESEKDDPVDEGTDKSETGGDGTTTTGINLNAVVGFKIAYQGKTIQPPLTELEELSTSSFLFTPQSLVDDFDRPHITDAKLTNIRLEATLLETGDFRLVKSELNYDTTVTSEGKTGKLTPLDVAEVDVPQHLDCYKKNTDGDCVEAIIVSHTSITTKEIEDQLKALEITPKEDERIPVSLETNVNGEVTLRDPSGQRYEATIQDLIFKYETHYALASSLDTDGDGIADDGSSTDDDTDGGCVDFFGIEILCPDDIEETETTLQEIIDAVLGAIGADGDPDKAGSTIITTCADIEGQDPNCEPTFDDTTIIIIIIALVLIMAGVILFSRRKRF